MVGCGAGAAAQARAVRQQPWSVEAGARRGAHSHARRTSNPGSRSPSSCPPCMTAAHRAATATRPRPGSAFQAARAGRGPRPRLDLHAPLALLLVEADAAVLRLMRAGAQARALAVRAAAAAGAAVRVEHLRARRRPSRPPPASGDCRVGRLRRPCSDPPLAARPGPGSTGATALLRPHMPSPRAPGVPRPARARRAHQRVRIAGVVVARGRGAMARAGLRQQAAVAGVRGRGAPRRLACPLRRGRLGGLLLDRRCLARHGGG